MSKNILLNAQNNYDFYETQNHHSTYIYNHYNPKTKLKIIDICCGLGSLINPWYDNGHDITLIEINNDFIPILKNKYPNAKIITEDYLSYINNESYDVYICNPPFNNNGEKVYPLFFCKILNEMKSFSICYFICPKMFYRNQELIKYETKYNKLELYDYIKENHTMPPYYYYDKYKLIELNSNEFRFNKTIIKKMIDLNIIDNDFIKEYDSNIFTIEPYFEFRYLIDINDFITTKCKCGLFYINL